MTHNYKYLESYLKYEFQIIHKFCSNKRLYFCHKQLPVEGNMTGRHSTCIAILLVKLF